MEIKIEVNEEKFKDVLAQELEAFSKEELHEICRKALIEQLKDPETFRDLFVSKGSGGYYERGEYAASQLLKDAAKSVSFDETFKEIQDGIVKYITEHHADVIRHIVVDTFMNGLSSQVLDNNNVKLRLGAAINESLYHEFDRRGLNNTNHY